MNPFRSFAASLTLLCFLLPSTGALPAAEEAGPDYARDVVPILGKYCVSCHSGEEAEGGLDLDSYAGILKGGSRGAALTPGHAELSRLVRVLTGEAEPAMPPEDSEQPTEEEVAVLRAWVTAGAKGPEGKEPDRRVLVTPKIDPIAPVREAITAVAVSPQGNLAAVARYGDVQLISLPDEQPQATLSGHRGNVNCVAFSRDGTRLVAGGGEAGLFGEVRIWSVPGGELLQVLEGEHTDSIFAAQLSPEGRRLATGGYDQRIVLWDLEKMAPAVVLEGHNGPVFDLAFHPDGQLLASASGDRTVKLWQVEQGARLDTLSESLQELYTVTFSPDGTRVAAAGVDNRIRVWQLGENWAEGTNKLILSRFGHERAILRLAFSPDGRTLVSSGEDRLVKIWDADGVRLQRTMAAQPDWATGLAVTPDSRTLVVGCLDGSVQHYPLVRDIVQDEESVEPVAEVPPAVDYGDQPALEQLPRIAETEPNNEPAQAALLELPAVATGQIHAAEATADIDVFRINAQKGDQWVIETRAARAGSPLDTKVEVLHADGQQVERVLLRSVRDSEIEFRGIDSQQRGARLKNWEEMLLNQYIYMSGEVSKLFQQRRGPDSDSLFYPENGNRYTYFGTSARAHALGEPCYVVVPFPPGTQLPDNGLPSFTLFYENDDDGERKLGSDSRLTFVAPADGEYLVRVTDVRGFSGEEYKYELIVRRPQPDFRVTLAKVDTVNAGSGKSIHVKAERMDGFDGPIHVDIQNLPPGFQATSPVVIEQGHLEAYGVLNALEDAVAPEESAWNNVRVTATAEIAGREVSHQVESFGVVKLAEPPKVVTHLQLPQATEAPAMPAGQFPPVAEIVVEPGSRTTCKLVVQRNGFDGSIQFDIQNLPHGVIVDDIGLNGVLLPEGQTERILFLAAEPWVPETTRRFHAVAQVEGNQASLPMILHVRRPPTLAAQP